MTVRMFRDSIVPDFLLSYSDADLLVIYSGDEEAVARLGFTGDTLYQGFLADYRAHGQERPCPEGCGCIEFYDDRDPDVPDGGFGIACCDCTRCQGLDKEDA